MIYHCSLKVFRRSKGDTIVGAAAYRSGAALKLGSSVFDYSKRSGVEEAFVMLPDGAPELFKDRQTLWSIAEMVETRKDSQVGKEFVLALPPVAPDIQSSLARLFGKWLTGYGVAVDIAIHKPSKRKDRPRAVASNPHAHVLFSTRRVVKTGYAEKLRSMNTRQFLMAARIRWREILAGIGIVVSELSHLARGLGLATVHVGRRTKHGELHERCNKAVALLNLEPEERWLDLARNDPDLAPAAVSAIDRYRRAGDLTAVSAWQDVLNSIDQQKEPVLRPVRS